MNKELSFLTVCNYFEKLEAVSSRIEITNILVDLFEKTPNNDIQNLIYLISGRVAASYKKSEFNIGEKILVNILSNLFKLDMESKFKNIGDIGTVFYNYQKISHSDNSFEFTFKTLVEISDLSGKDSIKLKSNLIFNFLRNASNVEGKFFIRILLGKLRLGFSDKTVLSALYVFSKKNGKSSLREIKDAYSKCSDLGIVANVVFNDIENLNKLSVIVGVPIFPKLVERSSSLEDGIRRFREVFVQPKFDGLRCQIHVLENGSIMMFSRNLNDITDLFKDFTENLKDLHLKNVIFDTEIIGIDTITKDFLMFQDTVKMKRKTYNINENKDQVMKAFIFDILYLNKKSFLNEPLKNRMIILNNLFDGKSYNNIELVENKTFNNISDIYNYFEENIHKGLEGVVIKNPKSLYTPGVRNFDWLKLKRNFIKGVVDTIDGVIIGYYKGGGARAKLGIGGVLIGLYNNKSNKFETVCKLGSGFSDDELILLKKDLDMITILDPDKFYTYNSKLIPDVWVEPKYVVVIRSDEITKSPIHTAGKDLSIDNKGFALRFPRFISFRDDKTVYDSTSTDEINHLYKISKKM